MIFDPVVPLLLLAALALDAVVGDPDWLWRRAPHPVVLIGRLISTLDQRLNRETDTFETRRRFGIAAVVILLAICGAVGLAAHASFRLHPAALVFEIVVVAVLMAQRSLYDHVARVSAAFREGGLPDARVAVSMIVGRDPKSLDEAGVCRAAVETTAENFSDGIVAPAFWYLVAGLPGLLAYKALNTADSMIGHRSDRHLAFGWAAARLDDLANLVPARLSGFILTIAAPLVAGRAYAAFAAMMRDARRHRSPNAGWPEAAMAGAFGLALGGPRRYGTEWIEDAWMNDGGRTEATPVDIDKGLRLLIAGCSVHAALVAAVAFGT
jgi:adenosylcobinamide-phosphate synthase